MANAAVINLGGSGLDPSISEMLVRLARRINPAPPITRIIRTPGTKTVYFADGYRVESSYFAVRASHPEVKALDEICLQINNNYGSFSPLTREELKETGLCKEDIADLDAQETISVTSFDESLTLTLRRPKGRPHDETTLTSTSTIEIPLNKALLDLIPCRKLKQRTRKEARRKVLNQNKKGKSKVKK